MESTETQKNRQRIWQSVYAIPSGKVASYGQIAALAGLPRAARFAGSSLKDLPASTKIPWHRVVNSQGKISLTKSSPSYKKQIQRLKSEGVLVRDGKVSMKDYQWRP
jgi:methylated-DNA-protein-cysteine methyltransferase-like protein